VRANLRPADSFLSPSSEEIVECENGGLELNCRYTNSMSQQISNITSQQMSDVGTACDVVEEWSGGRMHKKTPFSSSDELLIDDTSSSVMSWA